MRDAHVCIGVNFLITLGSGIRPNLFPFLQLTLVSGEACALQVRWGHQPQVSPRGRKDTL